MAAQRLARSLKRLPKVEQRRESLRHSLSSWCRLKPDDSGLTNADYLEAGYATSAELREAAAAKGISIVPLIAPTSGSEREQAILSHASGFVYYVSVAGVTGTGAAPLEEAGRHAAELSRRFGLPVAVGFGIDSPAKARLARAAGAEAVVVGTALIRALGEAPAGEGAAAVGRLVRELRRGLDQA